MYNELLTVKTVTDCLRRAVCYHTVANAIKTEESSSMARGEIDEYDMFLMPVFLLGSLFELELLSVSTLPIIGDPAATFTTLAGVDVSLAVMLSLVALIGVFYTNEWSFDALGGIQGWLVVATFGLILAPPFMPALDSAISGGVGALFALTIQSSGYSILSYLG